MPIFRLLVSFAAFFLGCHAHQLLQRPSNALLEEPQLRWSDILSSEESSPERNRFLDEESLSSEEQQQLMDGPVVMSKRRKGPTLSVVSPLEVLRQRLRLDRAKERIRENQKQIVANEELLEKIGKRSGFRAMLTGMQP